MKLLVILLMAFIGFVPGLQPIVSDSIPFLVSQTAKRTVSAALYRNEEGYIEVLLGIKNLDTLPIIFYPSNVRIYSSNTNDTMQELKIYTSEEWIYRLQNEQITTAVDRVVNQVINEHSNEYALTSGIGKWTDYNDLYYSVSYGYSQHIDYAKQEQVKQKYQQEFITITNDFKSQIYEARNTLLKNMNIVPSKKDVYGTVISDFKKAQTYHLIVVVNGETHKFDFTILK
jgi:hypothetical protein